MKTKQQLRDELALVAVNTYRIRKGLDPVRGLGLLDADCMEDALAETQAIIDHLTPIMDEVARTLETEKQARENHHHDEKGKRAALRGAKRKTDGLLEKLSCWRSV